ncbi:SDR family oxidoreductase [uncultured Pseudoalteromonas sp.]|uniref:NAD-dependent epimerase/dehydratase family protein n=1 Tax=uncultured Pseudoalteromonas sp. TaxID=114053 RepID=UPI0030C8C735
MALYTVFGGRGFIGSEIVKQLKSLGHDVFVPERNDERIFNQDLGCIIYCAGYGDCSKPFDVLEANVSLLASVLQMCQFDRLLYISSTRIYMNQRKTEEKTDLTICANDNRRLFNLTKLVSEELCLKSERDIIILRPSNVYGLTLTSPLFLPSITKSAIVDKMVDMYISKDYAKDYVSVFDLADCCIKIAALPVLNHRIYNIASGYNITAHEIANILQNKTGCKVNWHETLGDDYFPVTNIDRLVSEVSFKPSNMLDDLELLIDKFKAELGS